MIGGKYAADAVEKCLLNGHSKYLGLARKNFMKDIKQFFKFLVLCKTHIIDLMTEESVL